MRYTLHHHVHPLTITYRGQLTLQYQQGFPLLIADRSMMSSATRNDACSWGQWQQNFDTRYIWKHSSIHSTGLIAGIFNFEYVLSKYVRWIIYMQY